MTNPPWPRLSRDELVTIIGDYYKFLVKFYIPESSLKFPPSGGWPSITPETTKGFPRSPMVIDLLKHLPYIDEKQAGQMITHINYKCDVADYSTMTSEQWAEDDQWHAESLKDWIEEIQAGREDLQDEDKDEGYLWFRDEDRDKSADEEENWFNGDEEEDMKIENMVVLATGYESGGLTLILDVFKGTIHEDQIRCGGLQGEKSVEHYFDNLKCKLEKLEIIPIPGDADHEGDFWEGAKAIPMEVVFDGSVTFEDDDDDVRECQKIYKSFGWPGDAYRKEEAVAAIQAYVRRAEAREQAK
ncbi:hypothetical protein E8E12_005642 [Didymella heteroderae]|uniref:Uncharacterized protein n=1 Tax=Didymella heteroderae TaxID=1769908 RepID=A0A9P5BZK5_9PLEO|nr:hypothetical protein E8E12_005642 [Didymella heteroderae]